MSSNAILANLNKLCSICTNPELAFVSEENIVVKCFSLVLISLDILEDFD